MRRFDLDGDAKISFNEFVEGIAPLQPGIIRQPFRHQGQNRSITPEIHVQQNYYVEDEDERQMKVSEHDMKQSIQASRRSNVSPRRVGPSEMTIDELH